ncbi:mediator of RNA polymerase II transcription subunit 17 [Physcia stellaris]|nr:mediator of RNA polymerase II transcription subunit 17 [Physcia stellaris]
MAASKTTLLTLPPEILALLPHHLANIEDFKELSSTCRPLRAACSSAPPHLILRLAAASSRVFFRPDPYFLVAATAKQIGRWALLSEENTYELRKALRGGIEGLFDLCVENAGLSMEDIRCSRFTTFNPVTDLIDRCAGKQWYSIPDFWNGGRSDAETIQCEPERALFEMAIYGSLFHSTLSANLDGRKGLDLATRLDYIKYCIPDWYCKSYRGFEVEATGPYRDGWDKVDPGMDQYSIRHILRSSKWRAAWKEVRKSCGADFEDERRQRVWECAVQMQGLEGFEMLRPGGIDRWRERLVGLRAKIEAMDARGMKAAEIDVHGEIDWLECPILADEVLCCVRSMWPGYV